MSGLGRDGTLTRFDYCFDLTLAFCCVTSLLASIIQSNNRKEKLGEKLDQ
jgi:hypothetical protein